MAFAVQDNTGEVMDANAYIDVAFFKAYHTDRNVEAVVNGEYSDTQIQAGIIAATDYIDNRWRHKGTKLLSAQTTEYPREELYDRGGNLVEGLALKLKQATAEYALRAIVARLAPDPVTDERGLRVASKTEKVGPLEESTAYVQGASILRFKSYPAADMLLRDFVDNARRVIR